MLFEDRSCGSSSGSRNRKQRGAIDGLVLREGVDPDEFIAALETEYGEAVDGRAGDYFVRDMMDSVAAGMRMTNGFLVLIFLLASSVFIFNSTLMNIAENRRSFGVLKTVGMTPAQLRVSVVYGVGLQAGVGIVADSSPAGEYEETLDKARALMHALSPEAELKLRGGA